MMEENEIGKVDISENCINGDVTNVYKKLSDKLYSVDCANEKQDKSHNVTQQGDTDVIEKNMKKDGDVDDDATEKDKVAVVNDELKKDGNDPHEAKKFGNGNNMEDAMMYNDTESPEKLENGFTNDNTSDQCMSKKVADEDNKDDAVKYNDGFLTAKLGDRVRQDDNDANLNNDGDNRKTAVIHNDKASAYQFEDSAYNKYDAGAIKGNDNKDATDQRDNNAGKKVEAFDIKTATENKIGDGLVQTRENESQIQNAEKHNDSIELPMKQVNLDGYNTNQCDGDSSGTEKVKDYDGEAVTKNGIGNINSAQTCGSEADIQDAETHGGVKNPVEKANLDECDTGQRDDDAGATKKLEDQDKVVVTQNGPAETRENEADVQEAEKCNDGFEQPMEQVNLDECSKTACNTDLLVKTEYTLSTSVSCNGDDAKMDREIATPQKRSLGRPRRKEDNSELKESSKMMDQEETPQKRSRSSKQHDSESKDESSGETPQKRSRGRPRKNEGNLETKVESSEIMDQDIETNQKRSRGRPKGSTKKTAVTPTKRRSSRLSRVCTGNAEYVSDEEDCNSS